MAFKDNFRIEKIYFQRVKDDAQILGSWKNDPRRYSREEIVRVAKDACDSILMLYRLIGEAWNDALNHIEKLSAELEALAGKTEAYHDELNEKIDEVNNYLNTQIKNIEVQIDAFGGLPSNANASEGDVLTVGENHVNEWRTLKTDLPHYYIGLSYNTTTKEYVTLDMCYVGKEEIIEGPEGQTATITKIVEDEEKIDLFALTEYLRGTCLLSAYVVENTGNTRVAEIVDCAFDVNSRVAYITFNLTSEKHYVATEIGNLYYPALLLRYNIFGSLPEGKIEWVKHIGNATPVIEALLT